MPDRITPESQSADNALAHLSEDERHLLLRILNGLRRIQKTDERHVIRHLRQERKITLVEECNRAVRGLDLLRNRRKFRIADAHDTVNGIPERTDLALHPGTLVQIISECHVLGLLAEAGHDFLRRHPAAEIVIDPLAADATIHLRRQHLHRIFTDSHRLNSFPEITFTSFGS